MSTLTRKIIKCSEKQPWNTSILPPNSVECAMSNLLMSPITSPNDHSPVKPAPSVEINNTVNESYSIDNVEGINSDAFTVFWDINEENGINVLYKLEYMDMDGTYNHKIEIPLTFTYGAKPESIYNMNKYDSIGHALKLASSLNRELISHLMLFQMNKRVEN